MALVFAAGGASAAPAAPAPPGKGYTPGAAVAGTSLAMAYTATDGSVWIKDVSTGAFTSVGGHLLAGPALVASGSDVVVFGPGTDHALWWTLCSVGAGGSCSAWSSLGGDITTKAGAVFRGPTASDFSVYARGTNGAVWGRDHTTAGWGGWYTTGGALYGGTGPSAAFLSGHVWVLVTGTNKVLYVQEVGVSGFVSAGGVTTATPALTTISGALAGFARGTNRAAYYHRFLSTSPGWHSMGGLFSSGLNAASNGATATYTFGLGTNSQVYGATGNWAGYPPAFTGWGLNT
ncbi:MAG: hypothetical protein JO132_16790 [Streptosporangiaceae bacterium]|nr:hypothetical protein [Streptosporangiaceae bacterium]